MAYSHVGRNKVLLGVSGSIAAYKSLELVRLLIKRGLEVKVIMTKSAEEFIRPLSFETLTRNPVVTSLWDPLDSDSINHVELGSWADVFAIVPATAETISGLAYGQANNELLATALITRVPLLVAPAMNTNMYTHPATQANLQILKSRGVEIIEPIEGDLACGWNGTGCLADVYEIQYRILRALTIQDYAGKKMVITAGPTREMIDPVRFMTNRSSGKMGVALAKEAYLRGAEVELIHGPIAVKVPSGVKLTPVLSADEMRDAVLKSYTPEVDVVVMAAAVADFKPKHPEDYKIKKSSELKSLELLPNDDILQVLGEKRADAGSPKLVGFAVETCDEEQLIEFVHQKIARKKVDLIVGNLAHESLDRETNHVWIVDKIGRSEEVSTTYKSRIARKILDFVHKL